MTAAPGTGFLSVAIRLAAASALSYSGISKGADASGFAEILRSHDRWLLSGIAGPSVALIVGVLEIAIGIFAMAPGILCRSTQQIRIAAHAVLSGAWALLAAYAAWMLIEPPPTAVACGCGIGGRADAANWGMIVIRNGVVAVLVLCAAWMPVSMLRRTAPADAVS